MYRLLLIALAACGSRHVIEPAPTEPRPPVPDTVPELSITSPDRGTFVDGGSLVVTGRARDESAVRVTVNGTAAIVAPDGTFSVTLVVPPGLAILETHVIDAGNHDVRDVRSVLVGPFAPSDGSSRAPIDVRLGRGGLAVLAKTLGASASSLDLKPILKTINPVYNNGGCLGARADIASMTIGKVAVALDPRASTIATTILVDDIVVKLDVGYTVACLDGSASSTVHTKARITTDLGATVRAGHIASSLANMHVSLDGFQLEISGMPGPIEDILRAAITGSIEHAIQTAVTRGIPPIADAKLAALIAHPAAPPILGHDLRIDVVPQRIDITPTGVAVIADAALVARGGEAGRYVAKRSALPALSAPTSDADAWLASDTIDQLLASLWAAHAFDRTVALSELGMIGMLLAGKIQSVDIALSLPPTIVATHDIELQIGDLILTARDASGAEVQRFAISLRGTPSTAPTVLAQQLGHGDGPLDAAAVEGIATSVWALAASSIMGALPTQPVEIRAATAHDDFVVIELAAPP